MNRGHESNTMHETERLSHKWRRAIVVSACAVATSLAITLGALHRPPASPPNVSRPPESGGNREHLLHRNISATVFWAGEGSTADSGYIPNHASAWRRNWVEEFGGVDDPDPSKRRGDKPIRFEPLENRYYAALPVGDYNERGPKSPSELSKVPGYDGHPLQPGESIIKNRWIKVLYAPVGAEDRTAYVQWEDVGPLNDDDYEYVFGDKQPAFKKSGIDLSPAAAYYLGIDGVGKVNWSFIDADEVPDGPWKEKVTTSGTSY